MTTQHTIDLDELERLARAATPDAEWFSAETVSDDLLADQDDAAFIAAANPATVLELIERLRKAEEAELATPEDEPVAEVANSDRGLELAPYANLMRVWHVGMKLYAVPQSEPTPEESSLVDEGQE